MVTEPVRHRFTVEEYEKMSEAGIFTEDDRVELLDGEIVQMAPIGKGHVYVVVTLENILGERLRGRALVSVQNPVSLPGDSEPQPDVVLLRLPARRYKEALPTAEDVLLLIEVADTRAAFERRVKIPLYARAGVREVWLVDLKQESIQIFRQPSLNGYLSVTRVAKGERLAPEAFPDVELSADEVLG